MASNVDDGANGQTIELWHGYTLFFSAIAFFHLLNVIIVTAGTPKSVSREVDPWRWKNLFISWFHAMIVGTWDILWYVHVKSQVVFEIYDGET